MQSGHNLFEHNSATNEFLLVVKIQNCWNNCLQLLWSWTTIMLWPPLGTCNKDLAGYTVVLTPHEQFSDAALSKWDPSTLTQSYTTRHHSQTNQTALFVYHFSPLTHICIEGKSWLLRHCGCCVPWCWVVVWVRQLAVEARPPRISSVCTALIRESHGAVLFNAELGQGLFPLQDKDIHYVVCKREAHFIICIWVQTRQIINVVQNSEKKKKSCCLLDCGVSFSH